MPTEESDGQFACAILDTIVDSKECLNALIKASRLVRVLVIRPILTKLQAQLTEGRTEHTPLTPGEQHSINFISREHSSTGMQWGGCMREYSQEEIIRSIELQVQLLLTLEQRLDPEHIGKIRNREQIAGVMKAITDSCYCYVERPDDSFNHQHNYEQLKSEVSPTPEELAIRVSRVELGQPEHVAITYNIGRTIDVDIMPLEQGMPEGATRWDKAGKAAFANADIITKINLVTQQYDSAKVRRDELLSKHQADYSDHRIERQFFVANERLTKLEKQMIDYHIPLIVSDRSEPFNYHLKPTIQKLAEFGGKTRPALPLVATASGTTARTLIALQDMGAFRMVDRGLSSSQTCFDVQTAQYVAITLCGTLVRGGHHSVLEVGEIYNRLLDFNALEQEHAITESLVAYPDHAYVIGNYESFVPKDIRIRWQGIFQTDNPEATPIDGRTADSFGAIIYGSFKDCYQSILRNFCGGTDASLEESAQNEDEHEPLLPKSNNHKR